MAEALVVRRLCMVTVEAILFKKKEKTGRRKEGERWRRLEVAGHGEAEVSNEVSAVIENLNVDEVDVCAKYNGISQLIPLRFVRYRCGASDK